MIIEQFNLQFFSEEKTEEATPKKKRDARKKGQVAQSKDVGGALIMIIVILTIQITSGWFTNQFITIYHITSDQITNADALYNPVNLNNLFGEILLRSILIITPILAAALVTGVLSSYMQIGVMFSLEAIKPKLNKLSPISGFKRMFSMKSLVELAKAVAKGTILVYLVYDYLIDRIDTIIGCYRLDIMEFIVLMWDFIVAITLRSAIFLLIVAFADLAFKRWQHNKDLKMSKKEIKDEYKQSEGDPMLKGKIREKQRAMAMSRMMQDVPDADVVITNPTHYAVAVSYNLNEGGSPRVVAKGQNLIAQNIKRIATENDVVIVENKPLARALFSGAEVGDFIPIDLYQAVAEVLAYVYSLKDKK
ncbi:MAG: flagellar biosynthesis protein FlhB [Clostridiales bacterium]|nr:flagellar biosynthesis protein FlhB [Clostridiales bacterium]